MHWQKWDRGKHLRLCKAKAAWPETFAASDRVLHNKKDPNANQWCAVLPTGYCYDKINSLCVDFIRMWGLLCSYQHLTAKPYTNCGPALSLQRSQASPGEWEMVVKHWPRGPEERASLCGCKYNILCLCHDWSRTKGSDVKQTKTTVPHAHTHTVVCADRGGGGGSPGSSLHHWQCHYSGHPPCTAGWGWYHGTECQCRRGLSSSVQRVGGSIMNEGRGREGGQFEYLHNNNNNNAQNYDTHCEIPERLRWLSQCDK